MVGNEDPQSRPGPLERLANKVHLLMADTAVGKSQRAGGIDPQYDRAIQFVIGAEIVVDEALVSGQRRQKATQNVVERHVMVAWDRQDLMARVLQTREEAAGFLELIGARPLREVAADYHQVRFLLVDARFDGFDEVRFMRAEVQVGKVNQPGHAISNTLTRILFQPRF